ncbi:MAG: putative sulfate exporter family transporter [Candidatus Kuenenia stuttgartiensis]|nr:putative sulfate exporter family transporter [Candidatus Kuenenia stuttgartiensis]
MQYYIKVSAFIICGILCLLQIVSAPIALLLGIIASNTLGHSFPNLNSKVSKKLLQFSIVGLGFGMNIEDAFASSVNSLLLIVVTIFGTIIIGYFIGKNLRVDKKISCLISVGTAICGGSAIAATAPIVNADENHITVSMSTVFILNSIALLIFPVIGHYIPLTEIQFGYWSAIAIHDTSSVVGAASQYGKEALAIATSIKLTRALWIVPLSLLTAIFYKRNSGKIKIPWFIILFVLSMTLNSYVPGLPLFSTYIVTLAKSSLILTIFLIGSGLSWNYIKKTGQRPLIQGVILWTVISISSLLTIIFFTKM